MPADLHHFHADELIEQCDTCGESALVGEMRFDCNGQGTCWSCRVAPMLERAPRLPAMTFPDVYNRPQ